MRIAYTTHAIYKVMGLGIIIFALAKGGYTGEREERDGIKPIHMQVINDRRREDDRACAISMLGCVVFIM